MGHVDHGKTTVLDKIRSANVVAGEAGGITQHIGAYQVDRDGHRLTFIDTPGHAAFTQIRARGAQVTDIVVLVVAADDGVMPQTIEAINHARAADVPIIVAVNKIDKDNADPQRVLSQLAEHQLVPESWGGDTIVVEMSALQNFGVDDLLDQLLVLAELEELRRTRRDAPRVSSSRPTSTPVVDRSQPCSSTRASSTSATRCRWRGVGSGAGHDRRSRRSGEDGRSVHAGAGAGPLERAARATSSGQLPTRRSPAPLPRPASTISGSRPTWRRSGQERGPARGHLQAGPVGRDRDAQRCAQSRRPGPLEAVTESLRKLEREGVDLTFVHRAVGGITENDITLAATTNATILGFNVRPDRKAREAADTEGVEIRTYEIIYKLLEDIEQAMVGMLAPEYEEVVTGEAEVREIFRVPRIGAIAGCYVLSGVITRGSKVRFLRDGTVIWHGEITSLRRFKEDAREVREGFECGVGLSDFQDLKPGDIIETYDLRELAPPDLTTHRQTSDRTERHGSSRTPTVELTLERRTSLPALGQGQRDVARDHRRRTGAHRRRTARAGHGHPDRGRQRAQPGGRVLRLARRP